MPVVISDWTDVERLLQRTQLWRLERAAQVMLQTDRLAPEEGQRFEARLNRHADACGCGESGMVSIAALLAFGAYSFLSSARSLGSLLLYGIVTFVLAGAAGKLVGLLRAKHRFRKELRALAERLKSG